MSIALVLAVGIGWLIIRWTISKGFTDHHRIWLIGGALVGHSVFGVIGGVVGNRAWTTLSIGVVVIAGTILLLARLDRHLRTRGTLPKPGTDLAGQGWRGPQARGIELRRHAVGAGRLRGLTGP